jgi:hypothetical protein
LILPVGGFTSAFFEVLLFLILSYDVKPPTGKIKIKDQVFEKSSVFFVIDGANVILSEKDDFGRGRVSNIYELRNKLKSYGLSNFKILCDSSLKYKVDQKDLFEAMIENKEIFEMPAERDADLFILKYAKRKNGFIITNDRYKDYYKQFGKSWIKERRITFALIDGEILFDWIFKV